MPALHMELQEHGLTFNPFLPDHKLNAIASIGLVRFEGSSSW